MAKTKKRKVGDRIFYKDYKGNICTCLIKSIYEETDRFDKHGKMLPKGKLFKYNVYMTGRNTCIEDYNCLPENDPRVVVFCKGKKFITLNIADELRQFLIERGAQKGDSDIAEILYDLAEEFE